MARIRVRARAVDMLGRQQIAGIPTAIHELFKNAHDAYAERVEVDYFRARRLLILRDDGYGMTREDFEGRWLTLGTESKVDANRNVDVWTGPNGAPRRPILGEKGIGRLAIAAIGPQVLVLTRAIRPEGLHDLVVSLVHWGLFEIPGIDLDEIDIPIVTIPGGRLPEVGTIQELAGRVRANAEALKAAMEPERFRRILADLECMEFDPIAADAALGRPSLSDNSHGTHFIIMPTSEMLDSDIDDDGDGERASPLKKHLLGFTNTMMPGRQRPHVVAEFRDHKIDGEIEELIGTNVFLTPEDFERADHHFSGEFDGSGQFRGTISVYGGQPQEVVISWPSLSGDRTHCGPFSINFAYLQGVVSESRVPPEDYAALSSKLDKIGGLYIYRDGVRILPYGNSDYDFLGIERRRTKSASDWFFSYRRIFGAVELSHANNSSLVEKAGREGFRENAAYKELRSILENFFMKIATIYFREASALSDDYFNIKTEIKRQWDLLKKRDKQKRVKQREFAEKVDAFFAKLEVGKPGARVREIRADAEARIEALLTSNADQDTVATNIFELESHVKQSIIKLEDEYTISKPRGIGLSKRLSQDWSAYDRNISDLRSGLFIPLREELMARISQVITERGFSVDRRRRVISSLDETARKASQEVGSERKKAKDQLAELAAATEQALTQSVKSVTSAIEETMARANAAEYAKMDEDAVARHQVEWEERISSAALDNKERLEALREQFESLLKAVSEGETLDETTAALESRAEELREDLDLYADLAQIGMSLSIVQHEFAATVIKIRKSIQSLKPWADGTPDLRELYETLRGGFEHFDGYLTLFTPLNRRLYRHPVHLSGEEIRRYLDGIFGERLERHGIELIATSAFDGHNVYAFPSTFLPAFVNLVDNAIYWLGTVKRPDKVIRLDADETGFLVSNNGPGVPLRIADRIFDFGLTTKLGGRGIGLFVSREALRKEGFDLTLDRAGESEEPLFRLRTVIDDTDSAEVEMGG